MEGRKEGRKEAAAAAEEEEEVVAVSTSSSCTTSSSSSSSSSIRSTFVLASFFPDLVPTKIIRKFIPVLVFQPKCPKFCSRNGSLKCFKFGSEKVPSVEGSLRGLKVPITLWIFFFKWKCVYNYSNF